MVSHVAEVPDFDRMSDHDLLVKVATNQHHMQNDISEIEKHNKETNGTVAGLVLNAARQDGAILMIRGILAATGIAAAVAAVVTRGV